MRNIGDDVGCAASQQRPCSPTEKRRFSSSKSSPSSWGSFKAGGDAGQQLDVDDGEISRLAARYAGQLLIPYLSFSVS